jgi:hypothetical protein
MRIKRLFDEKKFRGYGPYGCSSERRTKVNPSMTRRYEVKCRRNQMRANIWDESARYLMTGRVTTGVERA